MGKQIIRLTESDLHRIIKESVKKIINEATDEVKLPGLPNRSMNGNSKNDWDALKIIRNQRANKALANHDFYGYGKNKAQANRNAENVSDLTPDYGVMAMNGVPNPLHSKIKRMLEKNSLENWTTEELQWALEALENEWRNNSNRSYNQVWSRETKEEVIDNLGKELKKRGASAYGESPVERDFSKSYGNTHPKQSQIDAFRNRRRSPEDQKIVDSLKSLGLWNG